MAALDPTARGYDALADEYTRRLLDELDHKPFDRDFLGRFHGLAPAGRVLDAGCGPGQVGRFVNGLGRAAFGVDISSRMVAIARERNPTLRFCVGDLRALPYADASFAGILAFYSLIHLGREEVSGVTAGLRRLLVPGGVLALAFHVGNEVRPVEELWGIRARLDFTFYDPPVVLDALTDVGFTIVEQTTRAPYAEVEAQTSRCYVLAGVATGEAEGIP